MLEQERKKLFKDIFKPKKGEKILFLIDVPHDNIKDSKNWHDRRQMAIEWFETFKKMGDKNNFKTNFKEYNATGLHNHPLPKDIVDLARKANLVIAMTEYSASSTLLKIANARNSITRCASMPTVERRMEKTAFKADYSKIKIYASALQELLNRAFKAKVEFSTGDTLNVDLRFRTAKKEAGDCSKTGQVINLPSGEAWKVPYEATTEEISKYGKSMTEGTIPFIYNKELIKYEIENNKIKNIIGKGNKADEMRKFFKENDSRRNIAEFAIGCNPSAVVTGNVLEDEKCSGLHIGYAMSTQIGGKVESDMHEDLVFAKGCPVEARTVTLFNEDGSSFNIIQNSMLRFDLIS